MDSFVKLLLFKKYFGLGLKTMKAGTHPDYVECKIICSSCGSEVETRATTSEMRVDLCSQCHPFYTGKKRIVDRAGRVDKFNQRRAAANKPAKEEKTEA